MNKHKHKHRWTISRVFRKSSMGSAPREPYEMSFDIVSPRYASGKKNKHE